MPEISVSIGNAAFTNWSSARIVFDLSAFCNTFSLAVAPAGPINEALMSGKKIRVYIDRILLLTGYIESFEERLDASKHGMAIAGRDTTADLVDCSVFDIPTEYNNITLHDICEKISKPFSIGVEQSTMGRKHLPRVKIDSGATAAEALEKLGRLFKFFYRPTPQGDLRLFTKNSIKSSKNIIREGTNLIRIHRSLNYSERFSRYIVKSQSYGRESFEKAEGMNIVATAVDELALRYRPKVFSTLSANSLAEAKKHAQWRMVVGRSNGLKIRCTVLGWLGQDGKPWEVGTLVQFSSEKIGISMTMLIVRVELVKGRDIGTVAKITLAAPSTLDLGE